MVKLVSTCVFVLTCGSNMWVLDMLVSGCGWRANLGMGKVSCCAQNWLWTSVMMSWFTLFLCLHEWLTQPKAKKRRVPDRTGTSLSFQWLKCHRATCSRHSWSQRSSQLQPAQNNDTLSCRQQLHALCNWKPPCFLKTLQTHSQAHIFTSVPSSPATHKHVQHPHVAPTC